MIKTICALVSLFTLIALQAESAVAAESVVEHLEVTHEGVTVRASVVPAGAVLAHTPQYFPLDIHRDVAGKDVPEQLEMTLEWLQANLQLAGASMNTLARINLYATTPAAAMEARKLLETRVKCAVSTVVTTLPRPGALVALDAVAVVTKDAPAVTTVRVVRSDRVAYISGMASDGKDLAEATRLTLEKFDEMLRQLGASRADVVHVKSFLRDAHDVEGPANAVREFFEGNPPPASWVEWTMTDPVEIEMVVQVPAPAAPPADTVTHLNPPPSKPSPLYSRVAAVHGGRMIYTSGVMGVAKRQAPVGDAAVETRLALAAFRDLVTKAGGDFEHLLKATYYPATAETAAALNMVRPEFFNPARPPAASKAPARSTGTDGAAITLDFIAVTVPANATKPQAAAPASVFEQISIEQFEKMRTDKDAVVLDVRTPDEFRAGHVPRARNIDFLDKPTFSQRLAELDKSKPYLVYCQSGTRSARAVARMRELGFTRLYNYAGSMNEWEKAGKTVEMP